MKRICAHCGKSFHSRSKTQKYCSRRCYWDHIRSNPRLGTNSPRWGGGKETRSCTMCGKLVTRSPSAFKSNNHVLCSKECEGFWRSLRFSGADSPHWRGGITSERQLAMQSDRYKLWRTNVLRRDGYACAVCQGKEALEVHHIETWSKHPELRYQEENGLTLCGEHHSAVLGIEEDFAALFDHLARNVIARYEPITFSQFIAIKEEAKTSHWCSGCKQRLPLDSFYRNGDRLQNLCKPCQSEYCQDYKRPRISLTCGQCGKVFSRDRSEAGSRKYEFCSPQCVGKYMKELNEENGTEFSNKIKEHGGIEWLREEYRRTTSLHKLAKTLECTTPPIAQYLRKHGEFIYLNGPIQRNIESRGGVQWLLETHKVRTINQISAILGCNRKTTRLYLKKAFEQGTIAC